MRFLLDTHIFLWFINGDEKLNPGPRQFIEDQGNERYLSLASLWELAIKKGLGKLTLDLSFVELFTEHIEGNAIELLHISPKHLDILKNLPFHHKDPFDRLIIAQALSEKLSIITKDKTLKKYGIQCIWNQEITDIL